MPPPIRIKNDSESGKLVVAAAMDQSMDKAKFLPFFQRLSFKMPPKDKNQFPILPYDYHCPSVQSDLKERICPECNIYFASKKNLKDHRQNVHPKERQSRASRKRNLKKVVTKRNNEALCIIFDDLTGAEDSERVDQDEIDTDVTDINENIPEPIDESSKPDIPIIPSIEDWLTNDLATEENK